MAQDFADKTLLNSDPIIINDFTNWTSVNESIMGGSSYSNCSVKTNGLEFYGNLVEEGGGFVSCRSPVFSPSLNLSKYRGLQVEVDGEGRTLKLALYCDVNFIGLNEVFFAGLHWVAELQTITSGTTVIEIPFDKFEPTIRAKRIPIPLKLNLNAITQLQLLHSKFGQPGELNPGFRPGKIKILLHSISGLF